MKDYDLRRNYTRNSTNLSTLLGMTLQEAIKELKYYQQWRMGADIKQPQPKKVTQAIEIAIHLMEEMK